ncbi:MAG: hypothetical protein CMJ78_19605 [Planctomycetaceae bacterium]|nr:hypothetical protein [Planctomycetaceae bacterium]
MQLDLSDFAATIALGLAWITFSTVFINMLRFPDVDAFSTFLSTIAQLKNSTLVVLLGVAMCLGIIIENVSDKFVHDSSLGDQNIRDHLADVIPLDWFMPDDTDIKLTTLFEKVGRISTNQGLESRQPANPLSFCPESESLRQSN